MGRKRSDTHTSMMESSRRPSIWAGSLRRDHIRLGDLPDEEGAERSQMYTSSKSGPSSRQNSFAWPFHRHTTSEALSTTRSSHFTLRTWQPRTFFRPHDDTASIDRSIVPDYVVNFIRGETPETLAMKKERKKWGQHGVEVTPHRETFASFPIEYGHHYSQSADATRDLNTFSSWSRKSGLRRHITGWRGGVIFNCLISFIILLAGIICLILVIAEAKLLSGESAIYTGDCTTADHINYGIHIVISVCGIAILSGANYVFQILSSPTRREVTVAHENKHWLDVGIPSIRNFKHISSFRVVVAVIVLLSAVASQVIYNAVIFTTRNIVNYDVLFVTQSFLDHAPFIIDTKINEGDLSDLDIISLQDSASQAGETTNMTSTTCLQQFSGIFQPSFNAVLLITDSTSTDNSLIWTSESGTQLTTFASNNDITAPDGSKVQYCLARTSAPQTCSVNLNGPLLGIAALLNLATLISMAVILARSSFAPLVTLGDAIRSFLRHPDPTTANAALLTKKDVRQGHWAFSEAQYFFPATHYWFQTPSLPRWALTLFSWIAIGAPTAVALGLMISGHLDDPLTLFGVATSQFSFSLSSTISTAQMALLTALPQLLLSVLYLVINAHLTTYFLSYELSLFALSPRSLRVSSQPAGEQTTSLFLTLPRPVSWALLAWFAAMGFSLSQAVFPGTVKFLPPSSTTPSVPPQHPPNTADVVAVSFSTQALLSLLALLTALILAVLALGCRRTQAASLASGEVTGNPLVLRGGACSAVISAKCHHHDIVPPGQLAPEETAAAVPTGEPWLRSIAWGVVEEGTSGRPGRCGFSADGVGCVDAGKTYV